MRAVIIGATGLTGSELLRRLLLDPEFEEVVSVSRKPSLEPSGKLSEIRFSTLDELPGLRAKLQGDVYFCCLGTTIKTAGSKENFRKVDEKAVLDFARIAKAHEARAFVVVSAAGADRASAIFYSKVKGEVEEELKGLGFKRLCILRPSLLIGERKEHRSFEALFIKAFKTVAPVLPEKLRKLSGTEVGTLAQKMVDLAKVRREELVVLDAKEI